MSGLNVNTLKGSADVIRVAQPNTIYAPGHVIQVKYGIAMERIFYTVPNNDAGMRGGSFAQGINQGGTIIRPLDITIIPKSANSWVHVEFNMFYETNHNVVFSILRDGQLVGAQFNSDQNAGRWVGAGVSRYDNNDDSTPSYINLPWVDRPGGVGAVTYSIAAKSSDATARSLTLNSVLGSYQFGSNAREQGVSFSIAQEIAF